MSARPGAVITSVTVTLERRAGPRNQQATSTIIVVATRHTSATRAKDSDRSDTCRILDSALADGQLSMEEHRTRVALATGAETLADLQSLVSDLQTSSAPAQLPDLERRPRFL